MTKIMRINGEKQHICNVENTDSLAPNTKYEYTKRKIVQDVEIKSASPEGFRTAFAKATFLKMFNAN